MSSKIQVGVLGARGRMGAEVVKAVNNSTEPKMFVLYTNPGLNQREKSILLLIVTIVV